MNRYRRRLPHWDKVGARMFVTFRLKGSLPPGRAFPPEQLTAGQAFGAMDRLLDRANCGPIYLSRPEIAQIVRDSIRDGDRKFRRYDLHSFVIMPNHVHLLVTGHIPLSRWLGPLKGYTAHEANRILGRAGTAFWQEESYDRLVRDDEEFFRIRKYIEWNPVRAGLATAPEEYLWCALTPGGSPAAGQKP